jgi:hypothetical protein
MGSNKERNQVIADYLKKHPEMNHQRLAELIVEETGIDLTANAVRKRIQRIIKKGDQWSIPKPDKKAYKNESVDSDQTVDDDFDNRSKGHIERDENNIITHYSYFIYIRDKSSLTGEFTRDEMDKIYRLYSANDGSNLNQRSVSREFPSITFRDFKRILRAFSITKDSVPVAPHILEETAPDKVASIIRQNKENVVLKKLDEDRSKHYETLWKKAVKQLVELQESKGSAEDFLKQIVEQNTSDQKPVRIHNTNNGKVSINIYLSDLHIGAYVDKQEAVYANDWDEAKVFEAAEHVINEIIYLSELYGRFENINICSMGDEVDGMSMQTSRGGHHLPQNMNNKTQLRVWVKLMRYFIDQIHNLNVADHISTYIVADSNHPGDFSYGAAIAIETFSEFKYPDMKCEVFDKFMGHFQQGQHCFILTHGKDKEIMSRGWPLYLNDRVKSQINDYIKYNGIAKYNLHLVKGDLHQTAFEDTRDFTYRNTLSWFGNSIYAMNNFGHGQRGCSYDLFWTGNDRLLVGELKF